MPNNVRIGTQVGGVGKASSDLDRLRDKFDKLQRQGAKGFTIGAGAAVTTAGIGLIGSAVGQLGDVLGDATAAAIAEERSIVKLGTALKANVPEWDGQTAAIERVLAKRMALGFSDDEQRESLALAVVATKDANKALDLQRTAMDLARLKGIDLRTATESLIKVEGGQFRALKALGIELRDGATATEALAAVQEAAEGQAEAFAATNEGKLLKSQIAVDETFEKFGAVTLPIVAEAADVVVKALDRASISFEELEEGARTGSYGAAVQLANLKSEAVQSANRVIESQKHLGREYKDVTDDVATDSARMAGAIDDSTDDVVLSWQDMVDTLKTDVGRLIDEVHDPAIQYGELAAIAEEDAAQRKIIASKDSTNQEIREAKRRRRELAKQADETRLDLLEAGELTAEDTEDWLTDLRKDYDKETGKAKTRIGQLIAKIEELRRLANAPIKVAVKVHFAGGGSAPSGSANDPRRARGGPVNPNKVYMVGEEGPELFVANDAGTIVPNDKLGGGSPVGFGGGGGGDMYLTVHVHPAPGMTPAQARAFGDAFGPVIESWRQRNGHSPRTASPMRG